MNTIEIICGDALTEMPRLIERGITVGVCLADPPYGTTACAWDSVIPFEPMWDCLKGLVKKNGAIALFGSQPFTSALVMSNPQMWKHQWVWDKAQSGSFQNAKFAPLKTTEDIVIFANSTVNYFPEMRIGKLRIKGGCRKPTEVFNGLKPNYQILSDEYLPTHILRFPNCASKGERVHPTQKPVELMRYLVRTYSNEGDTILDFTCGSGSTGVACVIENRNFIGIEQDEYYCEVARARILRAQGQWAEIPKSIKREVELPLFNQVA